ncbi:hypothetical protein JW592_07550, partial [Streptomyces sp. DW4-2]|nr:hypothetical protein [Streptomyces spirodelae]
KRSHCHPNTDTHLAGPPLGIQQETRPSTTRLLARRLMGSAADELTRIAIKATCTGTLLLLALWLGRY